MLQNFSKELPSDNKPFWAGTEPFLQLKKWSETQKPGEQTNPENTMERHIAERNWFASPQGR